MFQHEDFTPGAYLRGNTGKSQRMEAFFRSSFFFFFPFLHIFLTSGNLLKRHRQTRIEKKNTLRCSHIPRGRHQAGCRSCIHSCVSQKHTTLYVQTPSLTIPPPPPRISHTNSCITTLLQLLLDTLFQKKKKKNAADFNCARQECRDDCKTRLFREKAQKGERVPLELN